MAGYVRPNKKDSHGCPACATQRDIERMKKANEKRTFSIKEVQKKLDKKFYGTIEVLEYSSMRSQNLFKCADCGHIFRLKGYSILSKDRHSGCPNCVTGSNGERRVRNFLKENNIKFDEQVTVDGLNGVNGSALRLDFYLTDYNVYIEYNGRQHYMPIPYGGNEKLAEKKFQEQQLNDKRKIEFLKSVLKIIRYDDVFEERVNEILSEVV